MNPAMLYVYVGAAQTIHKLTQAAVKHGEDKAKPELREKLLQKLFHMSEELLTTVKEELLKSVDIPMAEQLLAETLADRLSVVSKLAEQKQEIDWQAFDYEVVAKEEIQLGKKFLVRILLEPYEHFPTVEVCELPRNAESLRVDLVRILLLHEEDGRLGELDRNARREGGVYWHVFQPLENRVKPKVQIVGPLALVVIPISIKCFQLHGQLPNVDDCLLLQERPKGVRFVQVVFDLQ